MECKWLWFDNNLSIALIILLFIDKIKENYCFIVNTLENTKQFNM